MREKDFRGFAFFSFALLPFLLTKKRSSSLSNSSSSFSTTAAGAVAVAVLGVFGVFQMAGAVARGTGRSLVASESEREGTSVSGQGGTGGVATS